LPADCSQELDIPQRRTGLNGEREGAAAMKTYVHVIGAAGIGVVLAWSLARTIAGWLIPEMSGIHAHRAERVMGERELRIEVE
jgi:hypothetical protein